MHRFLGVFVLWTLSCLVSSEHDRVLQLPGLSQSIPFRMYSGYLNASEGKYLHYMFVESTNDPPNDPLVLWLNGGPGCSSLLGFWTEQGPFRVQPGGQKVEPNPWSWNSVANMIFLESPAGVGFSYSDSRNYTTDDDITSMDNLLAIKSFFKKFPAYRQNDFYLSGESYAGVYIPTLSVRLLSEPDILYKGFAIGNGYLDQEKLGNSKVYFAYYHGLLDHAEWSILTEPCCSNHIADEEHCEFVKNPNPTCNRLVSNITQRIASYGLNPYNVYDKCDSNNLNQKPHQHHKLSYGRSLAGWNLLLKPLKASKEDTPVLPCVSDADLEAYLNNGYVRKVLHIPSFVPKWTDCNEKILDTYGNIYKSLKKQVLQSLKAGKRGMIYNGDIDMVCDFLGDQWFVEDLGIPAKSEYSAWHVDNQTAGFVKRFDSDLTLVTVRGAGHMVPTDRPVAALSMFKTFLNNDNFV